MKEENKVLTRRCRSQQFAEKNVDQNWLVVFIQVCSGLAKLQFVKETKTHCDS